MSTTYELDPMHSAAHFAIRHLMIAHVRGQFTSLSGSLVTDSANPEQSQVNITIDSNSIQTGQPPRDEHLKGADFLDTAQYPTMTFQSKRIANIQADSAQVVGDFTLRGVTKEVTLNVSGSLHEIKDVWGNQRVGFTGTTQINRSEFGLTWNAPLETGGVVLSDELDITLEVQFVKKG